MYLKGGVPVVTEKKSSEKKIIFDYYYGREAEQFTFYRIPKLLVTHPVFRELSSDSKLLYGLMLDRLSLSKSNGWFDEKNRVYIIYSVQDIMNDLGCANQKAIKLMKELSSIGLITKKRRGLGMPDLIFVMNFITPTEFYDERFRGGDDGDDQKDDDGASSSVKESESDRSKGSAKGSHFKKCENHTSENVKNTSLEMCESHSNKNYSNKTKINNIKINLSVSDENKGRMDGSDEFDSKISSSLEMQVRRNLNIDHYERYGNGEDLEFIRCAYDLITEVLCLKVKEIKINGCMYDHSLVKKRFLMLTDEHVLYVKDCMKQHSSEIRNIRSYLLTSLFNAPATIDSFYSQQVWSDSRMLS